MEQRKTSRKTIRVAVYCRTATDHEKKQNLEAQKENLLQYAVTQGYDVAKIIAEKTSGSSLGRSGIRTIYDLAEKPDIDAALTVDRARFGRNPLQVINLEETLKKFHVQLETLQSNKPSRFWDSEQFDRHRG